MLNVKVTRDVTFGTLRYCFSHFCCTECGLLFSIVLKQKVKLRSLLSGRWPISDADDRLFNIKMHQKCCWLLVDRWSTDRQSTDTVSSHSRPTYQATVDQLSAKICKTVDQLWPTVGRLSADTSTDSRPTIDRLSADISTDSRSTVDQRELKYTWSVIFVSYENDRLQTLFLCFVCCPMKKIDINSEKCIEYGQ